MSLELRFTIPGQVERVVPLSESIVRMGALLSNQVVLRAPGVDPIHALLEDDNGRWMLTDLGSVTGVKINGEIIDVEREVKAGDTLTVGSVEITVAAATDDATVLAQPAAAPPPPPADENMAATQVATPADPPPTKPAADKKTVRVPPEQQAARRAAAGGEPERRERKKDLLFSPRGAKPSGDVLEVVAYWGDTVLEVELFHPAEKGFDRVTIGDPTKAHLISGGKSNFDAYPLAKVKDGGYTLNMRGSMQARLRKGGKVEKVKGDQKISMGRRDIAHVQYGAVRYFMMFVRPPAIQLPRSGPRDPFFMGLATFSFVLYLMIISAVMVHTPSEKEDEKDDIWSIVQVPEKDKRPKPVIEKKKKEKKPPKPPVKLAEKKKPPPKPKPPTPKPPPPKPAKPVEKEKPKQTKPTKTPQKVNKNIDALAQKTPKKATPRPPSPKPPSPNPTPTRSKSKSKGAPGPKSPKKTVGKGMPSTGAKNPNFKLAGPKLKNVKLGKSGGQKGAGMNQTGGAIKGKQRASVMGVEGAKNNKASGVNLSKLGLGVGKIMNKKGAGAIKTNFKSSAGGAGGGMGSASKTYGMGGVGSGKSLGIAGGNTGANNFGSGSGGLLSGQGGSGGYGGGGLSGAFGGGGGGGGRGRANVTVPPGDPVVSGGLTPQEIMAVIRANLNQIRHCYELTLQRSPNASGKMSVRFVINPQGRVQSVSVTSSTISDSRMRGCVTGKIRRWPFPRPRGGQPVTVNYPFVFNPL